MSFMAFILQNVSASLLHAVWQCTEFSKETYTCTDKVHTDYMSLNKYLESSSYEIGLHILFEGNNVNVFSKVTL